ncbi:hypothetical protein HY734_03730 [Candidatus Uhrbacteria bacterium]|nr:hypothetical protein [Candidatus Uhrbacteria bacterium]
MFRLLLALSLVALGSATLVPQAQAFAVGPAILELTGSRGETVSSQIRIANTNDAEHTYYLHTRAFEPKEESGTPAFVPSDAGRAGLPEWIAFPAGSVTIPAGQSADVSFVIAIPSDVPAGSHYGAIVVSDAPYDVVATNGASVQANTAILIFLTVAGETVEQAALLDFTGPKEGQWLSTAAGTFSYRIQNQGNVHVVPTGTVTFRDAFGRVLGTFDANPGKGRVLPRTTRTFETPFGETNKNGFWQTTGNQMRSLTVGPVTAALDVTYGSTPKTIHSEIVFWVVPWQLFMVGVGFLLLFTLLYKGYGRALKARTRIHEPMPS